jgi:hypothetical protein
VCEYPEETRGEESLSGAGFRGRGLLGVGLSGDRAGALKPSGFSADNPTPLTWASFAGNGLTAMPKSETLPCLAGEGSSPREDE